MSELRQEFLKQTVSNLETLQNEFSADALSEDFLRRYFRVLHTIKGTSNTFSLFFLAKPTHEIESLVQAVQKNQIPQNESTISVFQESLVQLLQIARSYQKGKAVPVSSDFANRLQNFTPPKTDSNELFIFQIPQRILSKLSMTEKDALNLEIQKGKTFYLLRVNFALQNFAEDFKNFKDILNHSGEVIAVASGANKNPAQEINFQVFFTSDFRRAEVEKLIENYCAQIEFKNISSAKNLPENLAEVLENLVSYGEKTAQFLNKHIAFETNFSNTKISAKHLILLNEVASHLLHNAIDHAIESAEERVLHGKSPTAKIKINFEKSADHFLFQIEDDGGGIDVEKIIAVAKEKGLAVENEKEAIELIFSQGFSTSQTVSEISGRGVGLDAVKDLVEKSGGRIEVKTKGGLGTTFSVYLPID